MIRLQGLKMKIKRTKPGTKTSEAKHEIVKSNELNGNAEGSPASDPGGGGKGMPPQKHPPGTNAIPPSIPGGPQNAASLPATGNKRASSGHRRDKARDKHAATDKTLAACAPAAVSGKAGGSGGAVTMSEVNGLVRVGGSGGIMQQGGPPRPIFPASTGPGPPMGQVQAPVSPSAAAACAVGKVGIDGGAATKSVVTTASGCMAVGDERSLSPPPNKKSKLDIKVSTHLYNLLFISHYQSDGRVEKESFNCLLDRRHIKNTFLNPLKKSRIL